MGAMSSFRETLWVKLPDGKNPSGFKILESSQSGIGKVELGILRMGAWRRRPLEVDSIPFVDFVVHRDFSFS